MARRGVALVMLGLALAAPGRAGAEPLDVRYEAFAAGFPVARFDFRLKEADGSYAVDGQIRTEGLLRLFYRVNLHAASEGVLLAAAAVVPRSHQQVMDAGGKDREAHLEYPGDGRVLAQLVPPEDPGRPRPTPQQILDTIDPLSAILAIGSRAARAGSCDGRFAVFDGRRRYDVVLTDEGSERIAAPAVAFDGMARRCRVAAVKIAGFSNDLDYSPQTTMARAWLASPRAGAPALPLRVDFDSSWGFVEVRMTAVGK